MNSAHHYSHQAMQTTFALHMVHPDPSYCHSVAQSAIQLIDEIEHRLSRYIEGSEVWQINHMQAGDTLFLNDLTYQCLHQALEAYVQSSGLFDITLGTRIEHQKNEIEGPSPTLQGQLMVDPQRPAIHCKQAGREIDLGGIGKGFTLDRLQELLQDFGIESALLSAGSSTQLAFGSHRWPIQLQGEHSQHNIDLYQQALSASGTRIQGSHIIHPTDSSPHYSHSNIWILHEKAGLADAWSTAALLMTPEGLHQVKNNMQSILVETPHPHRIETL